MARLVEAAVVPTASTTMFPMLELDDPASIEDHSLLQANPAALPTKETAQHLFSS
jgi:hypothetical protein